MPSERLLRRITYILNKVKNALTKTQQADTDNNQKTESTDK